MLRFACLCSLFISYLLWHLQQSEWQYWSFEEWVLMLQSYLYRWTMFEVVFWKGIGKQQIDGQDMLVMTRENMMDMFSSMGKSAS